MMDNKDLLLEISNIAIQTGEEILNYYNQEIEITQKNDSSPLTQSPFLCLREPPCESLSFPFLSPPELVLGPMPKAHALVPTLTHKHQHHYTVSTYNHDNSTITASRR